MSLIKENSTVSIIEHQWVWFKKAEQFQSMMSWQVYCLASSGSIKEGSTSGLIKESSTTLNNRKSTSWNEGSSNVSANKSSTGLSQNKSDQRKLDVFDGKRINKKIYMFKWRKLDSFY